MIVKCVSHLIAGIAAAALGIAAIAAVSAFQPLMSMIAP